jgi:membrane-associated phospholipid phosphatase
MKVLCVALLALPLLGQDAPSEQKPQSSDRSVLEVKPGEKAIKNKDLWDETGIFHPFGRMPRYILHDQVKIWTSPFHTSKADAKWWGIFGGATAALIATDQYTAKHLPNTNGQRRIGTYTSHIGASYTLVPLSASFYLIGTGFKSDHFRETGLLGFETLINSTIVETLIKAVTRRARPLEGDGKGHFWDSEGSALNASFPSGHATNTFALASIFAHQYRNHIAVPIVAYSLAGLVVGARVAAQKHFPGDVVAGSAIGWFIGDYVFAKRHNPAIDHKKAISERLFDHVRWGGAYPVGPSAVVGVADGTILTAPPEHPELDFHSGLPASIGSR